MITLEEIRKMQLESIERDFEHRRMKAKHEAKMRAIQQGINFVVAMSTAHTLALLSIEK